MQTQWYSYKTVQKQKYAFFTGAIEPLAIDNQKYFHPSHSLWEKVPDRESAWRIKQNYYLWLPATEVAFPITDFQKHFALIVSIRVDPTVSTYFPNFMPLNNIWIDIEEAQISYPLQSKKSPFLFLHYSRER